MNFTRIYSITIIVDYIIFATNNNSNQFVQREITCNLLSLGNRKALMNESNLHLLLYYTFGTAWHMPTLNFIANRNY